ncbi:hypothetical protein EOM86_08585 [Candidatus Nomurabacteria bacterium]|nr:hypothetical protein [Candidatus Nomurabacteria bacterium]
MLNTNKIEEIGIIIAQMSQDIEALKEDGKISPARWEELILAVDSIRCKINSLYLEHIEIALKELYRSTQENTHSGERMVEKECQQEIAPRQEIAPQPERVQEPEIIPEEEEEFELFFDQGESILDITRGKGPAWMIDIPGPRLIDINDGITLNDKLLYVNDLFKGDDQQYRLSIQRMNEMSSIDEVLDYTRNAFPDWDENSQATYRFYMNVRRKVNG